MFQGFDGDMMSLFFVVLKHAPIATSGKYSLNSPNNSTSAIKVVFQLGVEARK
jgi:hypothetical protein